MRRIAALAMVVALGACGQRAELKPEAGKSMPPAPFGREQPRTTDALLTPPPQAVPGRSVELRRRSEEREDDPFDLPPRE